EAPPPELDVVPGGGQVVANTLAVVLVAGVLVALGVLVLRRPRRGRGEEQALDVVSAPLAAPGTIESALSRPPEGWAALADELASPGQYRATVRGPYLA